MKANLTRLPAFGLAFVLAALSGCVEAPQRPASPAPRAPPPPPAAPPPRAADWRDAPATAGDWSWSREGTASVARFGAGAFTVRCPAAGSPIVLERAGSVGGPAPMTVSTTAISRRLTAQPFTDGVPVIGASLTDGDPLLDAMAFSRGRIAIEVAGMPPLFIPAWPELARVIEDCR